MNMLEGDYTEAKVPIKRGKRKGKGKGKGKKKSNHKHEDQVLIILTSSESEGWDSEDEYAILRLVNKARDDVQKYKNEKIDIL